MIIEVDRMAEPARRSRFQAPRHLTRRALRRTLIRRLIRNAAIVATLVTVALAIGATGYHVFDRLPWLDAVLMRR